MNAMLRCSENPVNGPRRIAITGILLGAIFQRLGSRNLLTVKHLASCGYCRYIYENLMIWTELKTSATDGNKLKLQLDFLSRHQAGPRAAQLI